MSGSSVSSEHQRHTTGHRESHSTEKMAAVYYKDETPRFSRLKSRNLHHDDGEQAPRLAMGVVTEARPGKATSQQSGDRVTPVLEIT